ncbi:MAG: hypothetical protein WC757_00005 [Candidatus Paceibacterota bacterium]|jgi:hypothetical protein
MGNKIKTTYRLPNELRLKMLSVVAENYGKKKKSQWINDAIKQLIETDLTLSSVGLGEHYDIQDRTDVLLIDESTLLLLESAMLKVRRQDPLYQGVQSAIIRAAIRKKLDIT